MKFFPLKTPKTIPCWTAHSRLGKKRVPSPLGRVLTLLSVVNLIGAYHAYFFLDKWILFWMTKIWGLPVRWRSVMEKRFFCPVLWYSIFLLGLTLDDSGSCKYWLASGSNESTIHVHDLSSFLGTICVSFFFLCWHRRLSVCATSCHLIECSETRQKYANVIDYSFSRRLAQWPVNN